MKTPTAAKAHTELHSRSTFALSVTAVLALTPMLLIDFFTGNYQLAFVALVLVLACVANIHMIRQNKFSPGFNTYLLAPATSLALLITIINLGSAGVFWVYPVILAFYAALPERRAWVANAYLLTGLIPVLALHLETGHMIRSILSIIVVSVFSVTFTRIINTQQRLLAERLLIDPLTRLYNRSSLEHTLSHSMTVSGGTGTSMTLIAIDIDKFKLINDEEGHLIGDDVLAKFGKLLSENVRQSDYVFRMGGEEFLVLLNGADLENGHRIAEKLRVIIEKYDFHPIKQVTASMGVAMLKEAESSDIWLNRADKLLYKAKNLGRNQVVVA